MVKLSVDTREIDDLIKDIDKALSEPDVEKELQRYLNSVYRYLSKKHGKRYSYATPTASERQNLRKRSGGTLGLLRAAKDHRDSVRKLNDHLFEAQFILSDKLADMVGDPGDYTRYDTGNFDGPNIGTIGLGRSGRNRRTYILIPLRNATTSNGGVNVLSPRELDACSLLSIDKIPASALAGEDISKLGKSGILCKTSGRNIIPMYVIAKEIRVPKRIDMVEAMESQLPKLNERLIELASKHADGILKGERWLSNKDLVNDDW